MSLATVALIISTANGCAALALAAIQIRDRFGDPGTRKDPPGTNIDNRLCADASRADRSDK